MIISAIQQPYIGSTISPAKDATGGFGKKYLPENSMIVDGNTIIVSCFLNDTNKLTYFCLRDTKIKDVVISMNYGHKPHGNVDFDFSDAETKSFDIPDYIPKEQHVKYIKNQFNIEE
jgi:hypothetical protein